MTPLRGVKATQASKSTQLKTNRGSVWIDHLYDKSFKFYLPMKNTCFASFLIFVSLGIKIFFKCLWYPFFLILSVDVSFCLVSKDYKISVALGAFDWKKYAAKHHITEDNLG